MPSVSFTLQLRSEYQRLFDTCTIRQDRLEDVNTVILGQAVTFAPNRFAEKSQELQRLLNLAVSHLLADGKAGRNTSDAYFNLTGQYLKGDVKTT